MKDEEVHKEIRELANIVRSMMSPGLQKRIDAHAKASFEMGIDPLTSAEFLIRDMEKGDNNDR